jgi:hypothetical protein
MERAEVHDPRTHVSSRWLPAGSKHSASTVQQEISTFAVDSPNQSAGRPSDQKIAPRGRIIETHGG